MWEEALTKIKFGSCYWGVGAGAGPGPAGLAGAVADSTRKRKQRREAATGWLQEDAQGPAWLPSWKRPFRDVRGRSDSEEPSRRAIAFEDAYLMLGSYKYPSSVLWAGSQSRAQAMSVGGSADGLVVHCPCQAGPKPKLLAQLEACLVALLAVFVCVDVDLTTTRAMLEQEHPCNPLFSSQRGLELMPQDGYPYRVRADWGKRGSPWEMRSTWNNEAMDAVGVLGWCPQMPVYERGRIIDAVC